jgi:hypothetical protein
MTKRERICMGVVGIGVVLVVLSLLLFELFGFVVDSPLAAPAREIVSSICAYGLIAGMVSVLAGSLALGID